MRRAVAIDEWSLANLGDSERRERLLDSTSADDVADAFLTQAMIAAEAGSIRLSWQEAHEKSGYFRLAAQIPVCAAVFDRLFNGRSGYRAQYYLSPEEGILYNRHLVDALLSSIRIAYERSPLNVSFEVAKSTVAAPHAKIWIFNEQAVFDEASADTLNPKRWVENNATRGRKTPLPKLCVVDLKGAFLSAQGSELFIDELKLDRAWDLHRKGYT